MDDGSAVILAVAKYYSPNGTSIPDKGVTPSIAESDADTPAADTEEENADQEPVPAKGTGDHLMERAVKVLNGGK